MAETLRVFVAGATGVLGRRLVAELADRGHVVVGLTRDDAGDRTVAAAGGVPRRGNVLDRDSLAWAIGDADVVVHAASAVPTGPNPGVEDWQRDEEVREVGARNLTIEAGAAGAERYVQASLAWLVRKDGGGEVDEFTPPNPDRTTRGALGAERRARAARKFDLQQATLRTGWFYAADSAQTRLLGRRLLAGRLPVVGRGLLGRRDATLSLVHPDDAAAAFAAACERWETGTYHVVDEHPVTLSRFLSALADRLDAPPPGRLPAWLARWVLGEETARFLSTGFPTSAEPFREDFDWQPSVPTYRDGLDRVVERWVDSGPLRERDDGYEWAADRDTERPPPDT